jgi:hypothetical protein
MWTFNNETNGTAGTSGLLPSTNNYTTHVVFTGTHLGKGMVGALLVGTGLTASGAGGVGKTFVNAGSENLLNDANVGVSYMHDVFVREIRSPAGGVMQFKGLTQTTTNDKYV